MNIRPRFRNFLLCIILPLMWTAVQAHAGSTISGPFLLTENFGPNGVGIPAGYYLAIGATVQDPLGVPGNIESVDAIALSPGEPDYPLTFLAIPIFPGLYQAFPFPPYTGQLGRWRIEARNKDGGFATFNTTLLDKPRQIPLAANLRITVTGNPETPTIEWDPVLFDHDRDPLDGFAPDRQRERTGNRREAGGSQVEIRAR